MKKRFLTSYCMSASLLMATTGCTNQSCDTKPQNAIASEQNNNNTTQTQEEQKKMANQRVTTPSGLMYELLEESKNPQAQKPTNRSTVTVHYTGWIADEQGNPILNRKFDSSRDRNQPFSFIIGIGRVIKGWDEGVMDMKVGEKRRLIIPADLAYGNRSVGGDLIPANSTLVFDVELLNVA